MAYGIFCTVLGAELLFSRYHWTLNLIGGVAVGVGVFMMAAEERTMKKATQTLLELGLEILRKVKK